MSTIRSLLLVNLTIQYSTLFHELNPIVVVFFLYTVYTVLMRNINKKEINILLIPLQHSVIAKLKETGINMSSLSRLAVRKFGDSSLDEEFSEGVKSKRVVIYLEGEDIDQLVIIAAREGITKSETLRRLLAKYLTVNEIALNQLF